MKDRKAKRVTYFDLDELKDASKLMEQRVEDAAKSIDELHEKVEEEMGEAGGLKGQGVVAAEIMKIVRELMADDKEIRVLALDEDGYELNNRFPEGEETLLEAKAQARRMLKDGELIRVGLYKVEVRVGERVIWDGFVRR